MSDTTDFFFLNQLNQKYITILSYITMALLGNALLHNV